VHYKEQKSVQLTVLRIIIITHTKFIRTLSIAQAIGYRSYYYLSLEELINQLINRTLKTISLTQVKRLPIIRQ